MPTISGTHAHIHTAIDCFKSFLGLFRLYLWTNGVMIFLINGQQYLEAIAVARLPALPLLEDGVITIPRTV